MRIKSEQLRFLDWEYGAFFHFGIRSCYRGSRDWDGVPMSPAAFNPERLDCRAWIATVKAAGCRYAILTAKHHDGFANWPSRYTDYSVAATPWHGGCGDVVREFTDACREVGLGVGLYYSPAQWGGSAVPFADEKSYDDYFLAQIGELLTGYGRIDYLWFDGCGSAGHTYDWERILPEIRRMMPGILLFGGEDPDTRWIGNEEGWAPLPNPLVRDGRFLPGECDTRLRSTWFDCEDNLDTLVGVGHLMGLWALSVGRGANLLLNVGPRADGTLPPEDAERLLGFAAARDARYGHPAEGVSWQRVPGGIELRLPRPALVDCVELREDATQCNRLRRFAIRADDVYTTPNNDVRLYEGYTVGHKALCHFPAVRAGRLLVDALEGDTDAITDVLVHPAR